MSEIFDKWVDFLKTIIFQEIVHYTKIILTNAL